MVAARLGGIIGNIVIAALLDLYCPLPTYIVAVLLIGMTQLCNINIQKTVSILKRFLFSFRRRAFVSIVA